MEIQKELIAEFDRETAKTRKMLEAIPADADFTYKPHPKSMSLGRLTGHTAELSGDWALHALTMDKLEFPVGHKFEPYIPASKAAMLEQFDKRVAEGRAALVAITPEQWDQHWKFIAGGQTWIDEPRYQVFREVVMNHMVHHRAQLSVYLRLMDKPIPGTYGPSADEK
jgi:uncharacterized damage-inducible protein DinB